MAFAPLRTVTGPAVPLLLPNVDTDVIIRVDHMISTDPAVLAPHALDALRRQSDGTQDPTCSLNDPRYLGAPILLAGPNFGCGSSREPAVWAVAGLGVRCIVAPSFGDIFAANCMQNGLLPITLAPHDLAVLADHAADAQPVTIDLRTQTISAGTATWPFAIGVLQKTALLEGLDDLELSLRYTAAIDDWAASDRASRPWAWTTTRPDRMTS